MENKLNEIHSDVRELREDIKRLEAGQVKLIEQSARHNVILEQHEQRSTTLEKLHEQHRQEMDLRIEPIQEHVRGVNVALKIGAGMAASVGVILAVLEILEKLR